MKQKRPLILITILLFFADTLMSQNIKIGDTLYVWAESGIGMRKQNHANSEITANIPYGSKVVIVDEPIGYHSYNETDCFKQRNIPSITYSGYFAEVMYKEMKGYLFTGQLSKLPPLQIIYNENSNNYNCERLKVYFDRCFFWRFKKN